MRGDLMLRPRTSSVGIASQSHHHHRRSLVTTAVATKGAPKLRDPAHLSGTSKSTIPVHDYGGAQSLDKYMRLPTSHYSDIDPTLIESLGGDKFRLHVPRVTLFSLWIEPIVDITVSSADEHSHNPRVLLTSESCRLLGSEQVVNMHLDERFSLHFSTELTWTTAPPTPKTAPHSSSIITNDSNISEEPLPQSQITGNLELEVLTEVIRPFHLLPRSVLEGTCNTVLRGLMKTLLPRFMRRLANDYTKWATESDYRHGRTGAEAEAEAEAVVKKK